MYGHIPIYTYTDINKIKIWRGIEELTAVKWAIPFLSSGNSPIHYFCIYRKIILVDVMSIFIYFNVDVLLNIPFNFFNSKQLKLENNVWFFFLWSACFWPPPHLRVLRLKVCTTMTGSSFFFFFNVHYSLFFCPVCSDFVICILFITLIFGTSALNYFAFHQAFFFIQLIKNNIYILTTASRFPLLSVLPLSPLSPLSFIKVFNGPLILRQDQQWTYDPPTLSFVLHF